MGIPYRMAPALKSNLRFIIFFTSFLIFSAFYGCGESRTNGPQPIETGESPASEYEPSLPIELPEKTYMGKEIFIDEENGYEYVIEELKPGNPPLIDMAEKYLGDKEKWPVIVEYNHIPDPRNIPDWTAIKIPIRKARRNAWLTAIFNRVLAKRTADRDWGDALLNMKLTVGDGVRTLEDSKATISYDIGGDLILGENSMIFISNLSYAETNVPRKSNLNLEKGTLNIAKERVTGDEEIEVFTSEAVVRPLIEPGSELDFRAKKTELDSTLVMSYKGELEVTAAGESVGVDSGEGSEIKKGKPPSVPEVLLAAPMISDKDASATYYYGNPDLRWTKVKGAETYLVEIAYDAEFTRIYKVFPTVSDNAVSSDFDKGRYYWRVCAVDAKGFEGYWSRVSRFDIVVEGADKKAPVTTVVYKNGEPIEIEGKLFLPSSVGITFTSEDDLAGIETIYIYVDGETEEIYDGRAIYLPNGFHRIAYYAVDRAGKAEKRKELSVTIDDIGPVVDIDKSP
jgi:hypothetical protein